MKPMIFIGLVFWTGAMVTAAAAVELQRPAANEINITSDSAAGWRPSAEQQERVLKTVEAFLNALDGKRYQEAYGMLTAGNQRTETVAGFTKDSQGFDASAGSAKFWKVLKITWTKDSSRAPQPGVYAAVDVTAQFATMDRYCGYMVLYQEPAGGDFKIARRESNQIDNATAKQIEATQSKAGLTRLWAELSGHCPNYVAVLGL